MRSATKFTLHVTCIANVICASYTNFIFVFMWWMIVPFPIMVLFVRLISVIGICTMQPFMDLDGGCKKLHVVVDVSYIDPTYIWYVDVAIKAMESFSSTFKSRNRLVAFLPKKMAISLIFYNVVLYLFVFHHGNNERWISITNGIEWCIDCWSFGLHLMI